MGISNEALSTEVPTLATPPAEPVLFDWDGPAPAAPVDQEEFPADVEPDAPHEMEGAVPLPLDLPEEPPGPPPGSDRFVDEGLALVLRNRLHTERPGAPAARRVAAHQVALPEPAPRTGPALPLRPPGAGLAAALALGLVAAFFGWVSAAPFWLAQGVGSTEKVTVVRCDDRCEGLVGARTVRLVDVDRSDRKPGTTVEARMLDGDDVAYASPVAGLHLRWMLGFVLVVACGAGVGAATGVPRLRREGTQRVATLWALSLGGPALLALIPVVAALF
ncbi:hypothetical protein [Cryptosporangium arvum]|uniref:Uncharacterized protein n=1 Tax=Cryptosporangium arvum DSM 44712 TaxID=927661 RepID=A0A010YXJ4_9ACTN|nr:hypothetical protein [Cryptosporangium arvum]EXG79908.1 hypothetical protein CryarDRAFT_0960 [Cryptosporangium arvum DSM 44712]